MSTEYDKVPVKFENLVQYDEDIKDYIDKKGPGVQSDWNETNEKSGAYINNKPTIPDTTDFMTKVNPVGTGSFSMNRQTNSIVGENSTAEGYECIASGMASHAEGGSSIASGMTSHAEGGSSIASGTASHSEGQYAKATGAFSHAEGSFTTAEGDNSHVEGYNTVAYGRTADPQHVQGRYNEKDTANKYAHIVGNGTSDNHRSNAHTLDWDGNAWFAGTVTAKDENGNEVILGAGGYSKPDKGIPKTDLASDVQTSLDKADTALQSYSETDPVFSASVAAGITSEMISVWNNKSDFSGSYNDLTDKPMIINENLLINPDFKINQRNLPEPVVGQYYFDRWRLVDGTIIIMATMGNVSYMLRGTIEQTLENDVGTDVVASCNAGTCSYDPTTKKFTITGSNIPLKWAKLERGSKTTAFVPPDPATELLKCQRYYAEFNPNGNNFAYLNAFCIAMNSNAASMYLKTPVPMAANSKSLKLHGSWRLIYNSIINIDSVEISVSSTHSLGTIPLVVSANNKLTQGQTYAFGANNDINARFAIDAEIY